jgi:hypothetical protein
MNFWDELFPPAESQSVSTSEMRLLRKNGRPLLLLPAKPKSGARCLELYPAQTYSARTAKGLLQRVVRLGWWPGMERVQLRISKEDAFGRFLLAASGVSSGDTPGLAILAGNPVGGTQRFIFLLFDAGEEPTATVKAGLTREARELIAREKGFLRAAPERTRGIPELRASFDSPRLNAFSMNFFRGGSPRFQDDAAVCDLLTAWINPERKVLLRDLAEWRALEKIVPARKLDADNRLVHTTIQHGDFAPWNIKVSSEGAWTAVDWERGRLNGIPGWDWFHYVIQTRILVRKMSTDALIVSIETLLSSERFKAYAQKTEIAAAEKPLLLAYLHYMITEIKPAEGLQQTEALFNTLLGKWIS